MIALAGSIAVWTAGAAAAWALLACFTAGARRDRAWMGRARAGLLAGAGALVVAAAALLVSLARTDLRVVYVAEHSARSLPLSLRLSALWAGQEGSLLLWAVLLAGVGAAATISRRHIVHRGEPVTGGVFALLNLFFALLLTLGADPFRTLAEAPAEGRGLHPQLQHWAMAAHPPMLFMGYAAFAAPLAIACGALAAGRTDRAWAGQLRRWALFAWLCLGTGIALGAWWAYVELGWGGYWAWDPVENASLMPWLTGTALIHSISIHQHRGVLKGWTVGLAGATFALCLFGTYVTRSGAIDSMHAFGRTTAGSWFLALLILLALGVGGLILRRRRLLRPDAALGGPLGRESATVLGNLLLGAMALVTLAGTALPLLTALLAHTPVSVEQGFYNRLIVPLGLATAALMAVAPLLAYAAPGARPGRRALLPGIGALAAAGAALITGVRHPAALACAAIGAFALLAMAIDFARSVWAHHRYTGFGLFEAAARIIDGHHRRYGGQLAHAGLLLVIVGVAGSKLFSAATTVRFTTGESAVIGAYTLRFDGMRQVRADAFVAAEAQLSVLHAGRQVGVLRPQQRLYDLGGEPATRAAIRSTLRDDLYVALVGWERAGAVAAIDARVNPLAVWIWIGAGIMGAGGVFALLPRLLPAPRDLPIPPPRERGPAGASRSVQGVQP